METPFVYGRLATKENFTDRVEETAHLVDNFRSMINTIIISPRRWGKSSLVHKASEEAMRKDPKLRMCTIDLFNVRDEKHFYALLAAGVLKALSSKLEEEMELAKQFLTRIIPKILLSNDTGQGFSVEFDWDRTAEQIDEILDLGEKIAQKKGLKLVICIDEFQNIASFADPDYFQKRLRAHWQRHQRVAYCLYGSKRHMMMEVFTDSSKPFYKFGDLMFLNKIPKEYVEQFIKKRYSETGKIISDENASLITELTDCHPYYMQQLAQLSWLRSSKECTSEIIRTAHKTLVEQLSLLFATLTEALTNQQVAYFKALMENASSITSTENMRKYGLTSATSVYRARKALIAKDIIDDIGGKITFLDPIYAWWLRHDYFRLL